MVVYLLVEAVILLGGLGYRYFGTTHFRLGRDDLWTILIGAFYLLLIPQVLVRSIAARISLTVVFAVQIGVFLFSYVLQSPEGWWQATELGRFQAIGRVVFFSVYIALLNRPPISSVLRD